MDFPSHLEQSSGRRRRLGEKENPKTIQGYLRRFNPMDMHKQLLQPIPEK